MKTTSPDELLPDELPRPGDVVVAYCGMRSWDSDEIRGESGWIVPTGTPGLVVQTWRVDKQVRLRLLINGQLLLFSTNVYMFPNNWRLLRYSS